MITSEAQYGQTPLVLRLLSPEDGSTRTADQIPLHAWLLLPETFSGGRPEIEVLLEECAVGRDRLSAGLMLFGRKLRHGAAAGQAFIQDLRLEDSSRLIPDRPGCRVIDVRGIIDISALIPEPDAPDRLFLLAAAVRLDGLFTISEPAVVNLPSREAWLRAYGGFFYPSRSGELYSDDLPLDGWALRRSDPIEKVELSVNGRPCLAPRIGVIRRKQARALPDFAEAACCGFSTVIERREAAASGIAPAEMNAPLNFGAHVLFKSGQELHLHAPPIIWRPAARRRRRLEGAVESVKRTVQGEIEIGGWLLNPAQDPVDFLLQAFSGVIVFSRREGAGLSWETAREDEIVYSRPTAAADLQGGFRIRFHPSALGRRPGRLRLSAVNRSTGESIELEPGPIVQTAVDLAAQAGGASLIDLAIQESAVIAGRLGLVRGRPPPAGRPGSAGGSSPPRLLVCSHNLSAVEGAPKVLLQVMRRMTAQERIRPEQILVVSPRDGDLRSEWEECGITVELHPEADFSESGWEHYLSVIGPFLERVRSYAPSLIYANVIDSFWAVDCASRLQIPSIWGIHESVDPRAWYDDMDAEMRLLFWNALRSVDQAVFVAESTRQMFAPSMKCSGVVIPNCLDTSRIEEDCRRLDRLSARTALQVPPDAAVVTIVGTTTRRKGQDIFLRGMAELKKRLPGRSFVFLIVGARPLPFLDELKELGAELGLTQEVRFIPETKDAAPYFIASDVLVISSREESAPLVSLEAFAYGIPLVSSTVFGLADQIDDGTNAQAFHMPSPDSLARKTAELLEDEKLRQKLIAGGRKTLAQRYAPAPWAAQYWNLLQPFLVFHH